MSTESPHVTESVSNKQEHDHDHQQDHHQHHQEMVKDFKRRFIISLLVTIPILVISPMIQQLLGYTLRFSGDTLLLVALSSFVFFYGGWPFLAGAVSELREKNPGMMTLISLAITVAYVYSTLTVLGLPGKNFYWELATLVVVMLLGHWIEMRSIMGASRSLHELVKMMPTTAHRLDDQGNLSEVAVSNLSIGDEIVVKPAR